MRNGYFQNALAVGGAEDDPWAANAVYFEYTRAANPIAKGVISQIPAQRFGAELYSSGPSRVVPLDVSRHLRVSSPATSPALCANFVRICSGDRLRTDVNASSQLFYVLSGRGETNVDGSMMPWEEGDFLTLPAGCGHEHMAYDDSILYWVHDEPLLRYLGAEASARRFEPTRYARQDTQRALAEVAADPEAASRSRVSVLLANKAFDQTLTITHVLWAMYGILPKDSLQPPHRHQSVALDLILDCRPGCYTMLGDLDESGERLVNTERIDWEPGAAFITPPGRWHSHHNESGADAHLIPIQDAGLHTYLRTLDIRFMSKEQAAKALEISYDISPANSLASVSAR
ncbi:cupin domain-containing protein [Sphaerisporangium sp. NPDC088356]|uniref:cupin domain-containing protein n=1 Tax=Sphaerisporangium sp. NPDC088356 TaxID=3154871 RepID=UPI00342D323C